MPKKRQSLSKFLQDYYKLIENSDEEEVWKDIKLGEKVLYRVSNHGRVMNINTNLIINPFHSYRKDDNGNFIIDRPTYLRVQLYYYENGVRKRRHCEISRLVAIHFIPIPKKYLDEGYTQDTLQVNHIRGGYEIYNNFVSNLEWCTVQENIDKAFETDLRHPPKGTKHHKTYLTDIDVINICRCIENKMDVKDTYNNIKFECGEQMPYKKFKWCYYNIKYKNSWVFISQNFNF